MPGLPLATIIKLITFLYVRVTTAAVSRKARPITLALQSRFGLISDASIGSCALPPTAAAAAPHPSVLRQRRQAASRIDARGAV